VHAADEFAPITIEYVAAGHGTHALALLAPETPENAPGGQDVHAVAPNAAY
jgi:hypothetical protein